MGLRTPTLVALLVAGCAVPALSQGLPTEPLSLGSGRVVIGAEFAGTVASADPGFFNYTDYEYSALRSFRAGITAQVRASARFQLLGELRMDQGDAIQPHALYVRIRPWPEQRLDVNVGRIPPTFGAYNRGIYGSSNPLIGIPLAYQYLTSLRPDALPATTDDLIRMRGRGWLSSFPRGNLSADRGVPLVNANRWDTGLQVHGVNGIVEWTGSLTTGSLSNPRVDDDNDGRQLAGRTVVRPNAAWALGFSAARGAFLSRSLTTSLAAGQQVEDGVQQAIAADAEYSAGRLLARGEVIRSRWDLPMATVDERPLSIAAVSIYGEARYRILPGIHFAARLERLDFSRVQSAGTLMEWDAPLRRYEIGGGWSIIRNVMVKGSWQHNRRAGGRVRRDSLTAAQIIYWF